MKVKSESEVAQSCPTVSDPRTAAFQAPPSIGFSRQEYWSGVPDLNQIPYDYTVEVTNRFKGLDLIDRVPDELWTEVRDIYRRQGARPSPRKRNAKKVKWLSEETLQIAVKRREAKSKAEKERYTCVNAEFQRIAERDKKAFLSDQCKEIEENNRMGKTRDLFKKVRNKGNISYKYGNS